MELLKVILKAKVVLKEKLLLHYSISDSSTLINTEVDSHVLHIILPNYTIYTYFATHMIQNALLTRTP
jgi:hypothetical protein